MELDTALAWAGGRTDGVLMTIRGDGTSYALVDYHESVAGQIR